MTGLTTGKARVMDHLITHRKKHGPQRPYSRFYPSLTLLARIVGQLQRVTQRISYNRNARSLAHDCLYEPLKLLSKQIATL